MRQRIYHDKEVHPCHDYVKGSCSYGEACRWSHAGSPPQAALPHLPPQAALPPLPLPAALPLLPPPAALPPPTSPPPLPPPTSPPPPYNWLALLIQSNKFTVHDVYVQKVIAKYAYEHMDQITEQDLTELGVPLGPRVVIYHVMSR